MNKFIELHKTELGFFSKKSNAEILVNVSDISRVEPYQYVSLDNRENDNSNENCSLSQITLKTTDSTGKSEKIIVSESYEYISNFIKKCNNEFVSLTIAEFPGRNLLVMKKSLFKVEQKSVKSDCGPVLRSFITINENGKFIEYEVLETFYEIEKMMS